MHVSEQEFLVSKKIDYNKRAHDRILALADSWRLQNPQPIFNTKDHYQFDFDPNHYKFVKVYITPNIWGDITLFEFSRINDSATAIITKYTNHIEVIQQ